MHVLVFGDSIAAGAWDSEGGWLPRLKKDIFKKTVEDDDFYCFVYDLGISGDTSKDVLERFEFETKKRQKDAEEGEKLILIFNIGKNDSAILGEKGGLWVELNDFKNNIKKIIKIAKKKTKNILFLGLTPAGKEVNPFVGKNHLYLNNKNVKKYNNALKKICQKENIDFIDFFQKWIKTDYENLLRDGLHPNDKGHKKIYDKVKSFLIQNEFI